VAAAQLSCAMSPMSYEGMILKFRTVLQARERLKPAEVRDYQRALLIQLVQHARAQATFYADRLAPLSSSSELSLDR